MSKLSSPSKRSGKTHSHISFITTPTADTPGTALLLHFNEKRYIIGNVHEGLQRAALQVGSRFFKAKDFFLTGKNDWKSNGGLLGMILTLADATNASAKSRAESDRLKEERRIAREAEEERLRLRGKGPRQRPQIPYKQPQIVEEDPTVTLHGGPNLTHTLATARSFIFRHGVPIKVNENREDGVAIGKERNMEPSWEDDMIQVWAMPISPTRADEDLRPSSPRKRSLGEYMDDQNPGTATFSDDVWSVHPSVPADQEKRDQQVREFVVSEMFNSNWRYDNLLETPLQDVVMPAALFVRDPETKKIVKYRGPVPDGTTPIPNINVLVRQPWPGALVDHLPPTKPSPVATSYVIKNHRQRGKFKTEAAEALHVPGPLRSTLAAGGDVELSDGTIVTSDMVLEPGKDGGGIAVVELPTKEYVHNVLHRPEWDSDKVMTGVGGIIWILGPGVSEDEQLRQFMHNKSHLEHIISSSDHCPNYLAQTTAATAAIRHHQIDSKRFPVPIHSNTTPLPLNEVADETAKEVDQIPKRPIPAKRGLRINLEPSFGISEDETVPYVNTALLVQQISQNVLNLARTAQQEISSQATLAETAAQGLPSPDAEIICLGTGSASPSTSRNVAGSLLRVPGHGSYLFDCGEATLGQLKRIFTDSELSDIFHDLKIIWISHLHADHHLGITSVIRAWYEEVHGKELSGRRRASLTEQLLDPVKYLEEGKRLFVVAHGHMMRWLEEYSSVEDYGYHQIIPVTSFPAHWSQPEKCNLEWNGLNVGFETSRDVKMRSAIRKATSLSNLVTVPVSHCYGAQAVSLTFPNGFKFSYSGDCRPSKEFSVIGKGSTVLLHEATFDDELIGDAEAKKHSTTSEAIGVGIAMEAKCLLLTHFSQRYQKIPSTNSMNSIQVRLEAAEEAEDPMVGMEPPDNIENAPVTADDTTSDYPANQANQEQKQDDTLEVSDVSSSKPTVTKSASASVETTLQRPPPTEMKIGVAFDYMRVKVGEIMHMERFTPALQKLYKELEEEEAAAKARMAANEAIADNEKEVAPPKTPTQKENRGRPDSAKARKQKKKEKARQSFESPKNKRQSDDHKGSDPDGKTMPDDVQENLMPVSDHRELRSDSNTTTNPRREVTPTVSQVATDDRKGSDPDGKSMPDIPQDHLNLGSDHQELQSEPSTSANPLSESHTSPYSLTGVPQTSSQAPTDDPDPPNPEEVQAAAPDPKIPTSTPPAPVSDTAPADPSITELSESSSTTPPLRKIPSSEIIRYTFSGEATPSIRKTPSS